MIGAVRFCEMVVPTLLGPLLTLLVSVRALPSRESGDKFLFWTDFPGSPEHREDTKWWDPLKTKALYPKNNVPSLGARCARFHEKQTISGFHFLRFRPGSSSKPKPRSGTGQLSMLPSTPT